MSTNLRNTVRRRLRMVVVVLAACTLAACGQAGGGGGGGAEDGRAPEPVSGDPLAAQPLPERVTIDVAVSNKITSYAALLLAGPFGEFEAENIEVNVEVIPGQEQLLLMSQGKLDVAATGMSAGMLNLIESGADLRLVFPAGGRIEQTQQGIWVRADVFGDNGKFEPDDLRGQKIGTLGGESSIVNAAMFAFFAEQGAELRPQDVEMENLNSADAVQALKSGSVTAANASAPHHALLLDDPCCEFVPGAFPLEPLSQYVFGPSLLEENPDVGAAVVRALARTVRDHLQGDYLEDENVLSGMAEVTDIPESTLLELEPSYFDPEITIPTELLDVAQNYYKEIGALQYDEPLTQEQVYDLSFIKAVSRS